LQAPWLGLLKKARLELDWLQHGPVLDVDLQEVDPLGRIDDEDLVPGLHKFFTFLPLTCNLYLLHLDGIRE